MYKVTKRMEISAMHQLALGYESKCKNVHGHNWIITVEVKGPELNFDGMLIDFSHIKKLISDKLDHQNLNDKLDFNPTAENIARWVSHKIDDYILGTNTNSSKPLCKCCKVTVQESEGNIAEWSADE